MCIIMLHAHKLAKESHAVYTVMPYTVKLGYLHVCYASTLE